MKSFILCVLFSAILFSPKVYAQYSSQKDAAYLATIKAVADYKINDQEELDKVEELRQSPAFNKKLQKMLDKLSNERTKNSTNQRILKILKNAGKQIYDELN